MTVRRQHRQPRPHMSQGGMQHYDAQAGRISACDSCGNSRIEWPEIFPERCARKGLSEKNGQPFRSVTARNYSALTSAAAASAPSAAASAHSVQHSLFSAHSPQHSLFSVHSSQQAASTAAGSASAAAGFAALLPQLTIAAAATITIKEKIFFIVIKVY